MTLIFLIHVLFGMSAVDCLACQAIGEISYKGYDLEQHSGSRYDY